MGRSRRDRSRSRSRGAYVRKSRSGAKEKISGPDFDDVVGKIEEAKARNDGSKQWQSELHFTLPSSTIGRGDRARTMAIRGPCRPDKQKCEDDIDDMLKE